MNWLELKQFCNSLPEEELQKKVILWREDEAVTDINAIRLEEDHYIEPESDDEGCFPESTKNSLISDEDAYPEGESHFEKVYDKGHPILQENF